MACLGLWIPLLRNEEPVLGFPDLVVVDLKEKTMSY